MSHIQHFTETYKVLKEVSLHGRYITPRHIQPLIDAYSKKYVVDVVGTSVNQKDIYSVTIGKGPKKLLMWSQMHGNESTTTKAVFDLLQYIDQNGIFREFINAHFTICIIPILNPDGAIAYTRSNSNDVDLNRDAQQLSQPESRVLRSVFDSFKPDFCFNLHDQRTIFSAGKAKLPATVSFLTPAEDKSRKVTLQRKRSMEIIVAMNKMLQTFIPGQVGRYDDGFNLNCVGDTFQSMGVPTVLFESGHYPHDYEREETRKYIAFSLVQALEYIGGHEIKGKYHRGYFEIPENKKLFYDVILRKFPINEEGRTKHFDVAIYFKESLNNLQIEFVPTIAHIEPRLNLYGHKEFDVSTIGINPMERYEINEAYLTNFLRKI